MPHPESTGTAADITVPPMPPPSARAVTEYVRHRVKEWFREHAYHGAGVEIAKLIGIESQALGKIRDGLRNVGRDSEEGFARVFADNSVDQLRRDAREWWSKQPESTVQETRVEKDERYPNRARAVAAAQSLGLDPAAIKHVQGFAFQSHEDPSPVDWLEMIRSEERRAKYEEKGPVKPPMRVTPEPGDVPANAWRKKKPGEK